MLAVRRRGFEATRSPAPATVAIGGNSVGVVDISDNTAPTVPVISATSVSSSQIDVALTVASTDPGGSGLREYVLERSPNGSSSWTEIARGIDIFSYSSTGLSASTAYFFRARAVDNALNNSSNSTVVSATTQAASGSSLFLDTFNTGSRSGTQNGIAWQEVRAGPGDGDVSIVNGVGFGGTPGMRYRYLGTGTGRWVEQRMGFSPGFNSQVWMRFKFWVPANYNHTGSTNDKFWLAIWGGPYDPSEGGPTTPGMDINFWDLAGGTSGATVYFFNRIWQAHTWNTFSTPMIRAADRGAWMQVVINYNLPTGSGQFGRVRIWRDPGVTGNYTKVIDVTSNDATSGDVPQGSNWLPEQSFLDQAYLMGWANSPQSNTMDYVMDDVEFNDTNTYGVV